jgi:DNA-binding IclR family transcriptional regulator
VEAHDVAKQAAALMRELHALSILERRQCKRQFGTALANLSHVRMYWTPSGRRILARAVAAERKFTLPADALLIGTYAHPFNTDDFLGDLDDLLAKLRVTQQQQGPGAALSAT